MNNEENDWYSWKVNKDDTARERLAEKYLPLVKNVVNRLASRLPSTVDREDLISEGIVGLIDAIDRFEPDRVTKFEAYAAIKIRGAVLDALRQLDWLPRSMRHKEKEIEKAYIEVGKQKGNNPTEEDVADYLGMPIEEMNATLGTISEAVVISFEEMLQLTDNDKPIAFAEMIKDNSTEPVGIVLKQEVKKGLINACNDLSYNQKLVIGLYYIEGFGLKEIGAVLKLTEARVCQIHAQALLKLRTALSRIGVEVAADAS